MWAHSRYPDAPVIAQLTTTLSGRVGATCVYSIHFADSVTVCA
jgi:hypothetical protein